MGARLRCLPLKDSAQICLVTPRRQKKQNERQFKALARLSAWHKLARAGIRRPSGRSRSLALQTITQGLVPAFEATLFALQFARFNQMLQATDASNSRRAAFGAPLVPLHSQLVFSLPRNRQIGELVLNAFSHMTFLNGIYRLFSPGHLVP